VDDHTERAWWQFSLPASVATVPADTEADARDVLRKYSHKEAPVDAWPCTGSRWATRRAVGEGAEVSDDNECIWHGPTFCGGPCLTCAAEEQAKAPKPDIEAIRAAAHAAGAAEAREKALREVVEVLSDEREFDAMRVVARMQTPAPAGGEEET
jgi:hypothetical protein